MVLPFTGRSSPRLAFAAIVLVAAVGLLTGPPSAGATGPWRLDNPVAGPSPVANEFRGIAAIPGTSAFWVVGWHQKGGNRQPLIEQRTAAGWKRFASPTWPRNAELDAVVARSADQAWAVGELRRSGAAGYQPLVLRWNGTVWARVAAADPGKSAALRSVAITAAGGVFGVGTYSPLGFAGSALIERWSGSRFVRVPTARPEPLNWIAAAPRGGLWAVGNDIDDVLLHRAPRSGRWHAVPPARFSQGTVLNSVLVTGPGTTVWVFGGHYTPIGTRFAIVERYQHGAWTVFRRLAGGENITSAARLGGKGFLAAGTGTAGVFVWSSDGTTLTAMTVPQPVTNPDNARIIGIAGTASGIAELAGWRNIRCSSPCRRGLFPFAERNP